MVTLLVMTDGRKECISKSIPVAEKMLPEHLFTQKVIHDDSNDLAYQEWLRATFPDFILITTEKRSGFGGAIRSAWSWLRANGDEWIFHLEDDFLLTRYVDLVDVINVLYARPYLVQMALRRQPWNDEEIRAGGIVEQHPARYTDQTDGINEWLEHRNFFTTNPSLYNYSLLENEWPEGARSEGRFGLSLFKDSNLHSAYWGSRSSGEWCNHIGQRTGIGY